MHSTHSGTNNLDHHVRRKHGERFQNDLDRLTFFTSERHGTVHDLPKPSRWFGLMEV